MNHDDPDRCRRCGNNDTGTSNGYCNGCTFVRWQEREYRKAPKIGDGPTVEILEATYRV